MTLTLEQVRHVAKLAELELNDAEIQRLAVDLSAILKHVDQLQSVPNTGAEGDALTLEAPVRLRADEPRAGITHERALQPSPKVLDEGFAVPAFVDD